MTENIVVNRQKKKTVHAKTKIKIRIEKDVK